MLKVDHLKGFSVRHRTQRKLCFHQETHDVRTAKGRASLDAAVLRVLTTDNKALGIRKLVLRHSTYQTGYHHNYRNYYDRNTKVLQESVDRLVVAGKLLPVGEDGLLIPC